MSAIKMTCPQCGTVYFAGVVGRTPWPAHICPEVLEKQRQAEQNLASSLADQGTLVGVQREQ